MVTRAVSSWSLHRTLGQFKSSDSPASDGGSSTATPAPDALSLLDLPSELRKRGYDAVQICHFHLPSRSDAYLQELRAALAASDITLDALLIDDGDLTNAEAADRHESWIGGWLETGTALGARRARISAGRSAPTPDLLRQSAQRLRRLAESHPDIRIVTENWQEMTPDAATVNAVLAETGDAVGLLIDLGNWTGPSKYDDLTAIAPRAETCHAKCHFSDTGADGDDYRKSLQVLKDAGFDGPLALVYDGPSNDEWAGLETEWSLVREVFA
ncbi:MAG TPA: sugar phosphate isomerase/epimerase [Thermomicrobiales bacterium]|nr:sugar phosphate isomerase/epimerase [Thermomicrobiales bacterium]